MTVDDKAVFAFCDDVVPNDPNVPNIAVSR